jgi:hypothetical protein
LSEGVEAKCGWKWIRFDIVIERYIG